LGDLAFHLSQVTIPGNVLFSKYRIKIKMIHVSFSADILNLKCEKTSKLQIVLKENKNKYDIRPSP
jgi:hypothetical protein